MAFETPALTRARQEVAERFGGIITRFGIYNRRKINNSSSWSQHSWPNALDIHVATRDHGDMIYNWLRENWDRLGIRVLLWWVKDHYDHLHVDFWPRGYGTPSTTRGGQSNRYRTRDGQIITQADMEEDVTEVVKGIQQSLASAGFDPGEIDGVWGPNTQAALDAAFEAARRGRKARALLNRIKDVLS